MDNKKKMPASPEIPEAVLKMMREMGGSNPQLVSQKTHTAEDGDPNNRGLGNPPVAIMDNKKKMPGSPKVPEAVLKMMREMGGSNPQLVSQKTLTAEDGDPNNGGLGNPPVAIMDNKKKMSGSSKIPEAVLKIMQEMGGSDPQLVSQKTLTAEDVDPNNGGLGNPPVAIMDNKKNMPASPKIPEAVLKIMQEMGGSDPQLVSEKFLTAEDVDPKIGRVNFPLNPNALQLTSEEEAKLSAKDENGNAIGLEVMVIGPSGNVGKLILKKEGDNLVFL